MCAVARCGNAEMSVADVRNRKCCDLLSDENDCKIMLIFYFAALSCEALSTGLRCN